MLSDSFESSVIRRNEGTREMEFKRLQKFMKAVILDDNIKHDKS